MEAGLEPESFGFSAKQLWRCRKCKMNLLDDRLPEFTKAGGEAEIRTGLPRYHMRDTSLGKRYRVEGTHILTCTYLF